MTRLTMKFMKITLLFIIVTIGFFTTSCDVTPKSDVVAKEDFTINEFVQDDMIISHNSTLSINGQSEKGVKISASIIDSSNKVIKSASCIVDDEGNYSISLKTPKSSKNLYTLKLDDGVHTHSYENIQFGIVFIILGNDIPNISDEITFTEDETKLIGIYESKLSDWGNINDSSLNNTYKSLIKTFCDKYNNPIGIYNLTMEECYLYEFLSKDYIDNHNNIYKYMELIDALDNENLSLIYKKYSSLMNMTHFDGMIFHQGLDEYSKYHDLTNFEMLYNYTLVSLFNNYVGSYNDCDYYLIQEGYNNDTEYSDFINDLRISQAYPANQIVSANLIPLFDCYEEVEGEVLLNEKQYIDRLANLITSLTFNDKNIYEASAISDVIVTAESIKLSFSLKSNIIDVDEIYGLEVVDHNGNSVEYTYSIENNYINIYLSEDVETDIITIKYGQLEDLYNCNLYTDNNMPIIPFSVNIII